MSLFVTFFAGYTAIPDALVNTELVTLPIGQLQVTHDEKSPLGKVIFTHEKEILEIGSIVQDWNYLGISFNALTSKFEAVMNGNAQSFTVVCYDENSGDNTYVFHGDLPVCFRHIYMSERTMNEDDLRDLTAASALPHVPKDYDSDEVTVWEEADETISEDTIEEILEDVETQREMQKLEEAGVEPVEGKTPEQEEQEESIEDIIKEVEQEEEDTQSEQEKKEEVDELLTEWTEGDEEPNEEQIEEIVEELIEETKTDSDDVPSLE